jgi:hypothetical protein
MAKRAKTGGRKKGTPNKTTALLKDDILRAAEQAGNDLSESKRGGRVAYLKWLAKVEPSAFATLLGKVLPTQVTGEDGGAIRLTISNEDANL